MTHGTWHFSSFTCAKFLLLLTELSEEFGNGYLLSQILSVNIHRHLLLFKILSKQSTARKSPQYQGDGENYPEPNVAIGQCPICVKWIYWWIILLRCFGEMLNYLYYIEPKYIIRVYHFMRVPHRINAWLTFIVPFDSHTLAVEHSGPDDWSQEQLLPSMCSAALVIICRNHAR